MTSPARITNYVVTDYGEPHGSMAQRNEKWFLTPEQAIADVKKRLGVPYRLHDDAHRDGNPVYLGENGPEREHDGFIWKCVSTTDYWKGVPSDPDRHLLGKIRVSAMQRPSPPLVNPFERKPSRGL